MDPKLILECLKNQRLEPICKSWDMVMQRVLREEKEEIYKKIEIWHNSPEIKEELHEYLGMTWEDYLRFLKGNKNDFTELLKQYIFLTIEQEDMADIVQLCEESSPIVDSAKKRLGLLNERLKAFKQYFGDEESQYKLKAF